MRAAAFSLWLFAENLGRLPAGAAMLLKSTPRCHFEKCLQRREAQWHTERHRGKDGLAA